MKSLFNSKEDGCFICGKHPTELHHIFTSSRRKLADEDGLTVYLCHKCHNEPGYSAHYNKELRGYLQAMAQVKYEETHTHEEFMERYGKNYI